MKVILVLFTVWVGILIPKTAWSLGVGVDQSQEAEFILVRIQKDSEFHEMLDGKAWPSLESLQTHMQGIAVRQDDLWWADFVQLIGPDSIGKAIKPLNAGLTRLAIERAGGSGVGQIQTSVRWTTSGDYLFRRSDSLLRAIESRKEVRGYPIKGFKLKVSVSDRKVTEISFFPQALNGALGYEAMNRSLLGLIGHQRFPNREFTKDSVLNALNLLIHTIESLNAQPDIPLQSIESSLVLSLDLKSDDWFFTYEMARGFNAIERLLKPGVFFEHHARLVDRMVFRCENLIWQGLRNL